MDNNEIIDVKSMEMEYKNKLLGCCYICDFEANEVILVLKD